MTTDIAFIGGGNMASAIIGGLIRNGQSPQNIWVVEPFAEARASMQAQFKVQVLAEASASLAVASLVVWAVKPQIFKEAAQQCAPFTSKAAHLSVAAGIPSDSIARWLHSERIVRAMPNTPALVGKGMTALFARQAIGPSERQYIETVVGTTGDYLWVDTEAKLDAVTALSGSGPAYVFYFLEAMTQAGTEMGLSADQARTLAIGTFRGASALAHDSVETLETLRQRVTSKGGTTYAALTSMEKSSIKARFVEAMMAAQQRAQELGEEFGKD